VLTCSTTPLQLKMIHALRIQHRNGLHALPIVLHFLSRCLDEQLPSEDGAVHCSAGLLYALLPNLSKLYSLSSTP
jgi:hypothetical protein